MLKMRVESLWGVRQRFGAQDGGHPSNVQRQESVSFVLSADAMEGLQVSDAIVMVMNGIVMAY